MIAPTIGSESPASRDWKATQTLGRHHRLQHIAFEYSTIGSLFAVHLRAAEKLEDRTRAHRRSRRNDLVLLNPSIPRRQLHRTPGGQFLRLGEVGRVHAHVAGVRCESDRHVGRRRQDDRRAAGGKFARGTSPARLRGGVPAVNANRSGASERIA